YKPVKFTLLVILSMYWVNTIFLSLTDISASSKSILAFNLCVGNKPFPLLKLPKTEPESIKDRSMLGKLIEKFSKFKLNCGSANTRKIIAKTIDIVNFIFFTNIFLIKFKKFFGSFFILCAIYFLILGKFNYYRLYFKVVFLKRA